MKSKRTKAFRTQYDSLQVDARKLADKAFAQWKQDRGYPGLGFKKLQGEVDIWRVEIGIHHRAVCVKNGDRWVWFWIGTHAAFDNEF